MKDLGGIGEWEVANSEPGAVSGLHSPSALPICFRRETNGFPGRCVEDIRRAQGQKWQKTS
jgi:hypothetical protein